VILVVSNAQDATADFLQARLEAAGVEHARVDTESLAHQSLSFSVGDRSAPHSPEGYIEIAGRRIALTSVTSVYYRRPVAPTLPPDTPAGLRDWMENEVRRAWGGALTAWPHIRWMNHPLAVSAASYKPEQLARAERLGLRVPETLVTTDPEAAAAFCDRHANAVVVKPVGHGEVHGDDEATGQLVFTNRLPTPVGDRLARVVDCPTLFQQHLCKDVDLRVTVVDDEVVAVALHSQERTMSATDCRRDNMAGMRYTMATLPDEMTHQLIALVRSYGLLYAAIDLVRDRDGQYWFLEINPAGQWAWLEQVGAAHISPALIRCLTRAA
jgi:hypothetical protein